MVPIGNVLHLSLAIGFLVSTLARSLAGNAVAGGLFLLALSAAVQLCAKGGGVAALLMAPVRRAAILLVIVGLVIGLPAGGLDLRPIWTLARLATYAGIAGGVLVLARRAGTLGGTRSGQ